MSRLGVENVSEEVLLAVLLRNGIRAINVCELARSILIGYGSLSELARASVEELAGISGLGNAKAQILKAALELARRLSDESLPDRPAIRTPENVAALLREKVRVLEREIFWVLMLDAKNRLKGPPVEVSRGLLDASLVHPREVFRDAISSASAAVVLAHNHPSGDPAPSAEDIRITKQLIESGKIIDIRVLDHVIVTRPNENAPDHFSLREQGLVSFSA